MDITAQTSTNLAQTVAQMGLVLKIKMGVAGDMDLGLPDRQSTAYSAVGHHGHAVLN